MTDRDTKPWDLLNPKNYESDEAKVAARLDICKSCEWFTKQQTCYKCGCIMKLKTRLHDSKCPIGKW